MRSEIGTAPSGVPYKPSPPISEDDPSRFRAIFDHSPLAIMYTDADGTITTCNAKASRLFGAPESKLIGFSYLSIKNDLMRNAIAKALDGEQSQFEGQYLTVTGNVLTNMRANFSPTLYADGTVSGVIGIFEDISDRVTAEKEREGQLKTLRDALAKFRKPGGYLPICSCCKRIRDDNGDWHPLEIYFGTHADVGFSHGICPECRQIFYKDPK